MSIDEHFDGRIVTQYVIVAEVLDDAGNRRLDAVDGDASGTPLPWWTVQGLLSAVLETYEAVSPIPVEDDDGD